MAVSWLKGKLLGMALSVAVLAALAAPAQAGWGHSWGSSGGSSGSWGSSGGSWGSSGGSWGSSGGSSGHRHHLFPRLHRLFHHHHSSGSHGSWGSSGHSSGGSWGSSGGSSGGSWGSSGGTYYSVPAAPVMPAPEVRQLPGAPMPEGPMPVPPMNPPMAPGEAAPADAAPAPAPAPGDALPAPASGASYRAGKAMILVNVPADAKVFVNGMATTSQGEQRSFVSRGLSSGYRYTYEVKVQAKRDGQVVEQVKTVQLRSGENADLAFDLPKGAMETSLTVHVPADAKVFLGGNETTATGTVRTFSTSSLPEGQEWANYKVRIEFERNGEVVSREETVSLKAGDDRTLRFDLDSEKIANAR
ncbi:MAG: hypothetical protein RLY70_595 [Planctomycetota bacterium]|jgi:uncharacterized protein (TIGR03000 family)